MTGRREGAAPEPERLLRAEGPEKSDEERAAGLAELAERMVDATWLDRETHAKIKLQDCPVRLRQFLYA